MCERALILDAMEIIYLARCGLLDALHHLRPQPVMVGRVAVREARYFRDECGAEEEIDLQPLVESGVVRIAGLEGEDELALFSKFAEMPGMDDGEAEAAALASSRGWRIVTDDGRACDVWKMHGDGSGTLGLADLLEQLVTQGIVGPGERDRALRLCLPG